MLIPNMLHFGCTLPLSRPYERTQIIGRNSLMRQTIVPRVLLVGSNTIGYHIGGNFMLIPNMLKVLAVRCP